MNGELFDLWPVGRAVAKVEGSGRYLRSGAACPRCGGTFYRTKQAECQACRMEIRPIREILRLAIRRAIMGIPLTGLMEKMVGCGGREFRIRLESECGRAGVSLEAYGWQWEAHHRRWLRDFDLRKTSERIAANQIGNLEVKRVRARSATRRKEGRK